MFFWNSLAFWLWMLWMLMDVDNLISGSFAFSKSSLNIWKFTFHVLLKNWRIVNITLLGVRWVQVCVSLHKASPRALNNCPKAALLFPDCSSLSLQLCPSRIRWLFEPAFWDSGKGTQTGVCAQEPHGVLLGFIFTFLASTQERRVPPILSYLQHYSSYIPVELASVGTLTVF